MKVKLIPLAIATAFAAQVQAGTVTSDGADIIIKTKGGFEAKTADGDYEFKIGGRIQLDYNSYDGVINKEEGETGSDLFFRRGRIEMKGKIKDWGYEASYNLTDSGSIDQLNTTYLGWGKTALLTFGQQKENFGLEDTGSSKWTTAIERSLPASAFDTGNTVGIKFHGATDLITYNLGVFKSAIDADDNSLDTAVTGRFVIRPVNTGDTLVHLGVGYSMRDGEFDEIGARLGVRGGEDKTANKVKAEYNSGLMGDEMKFWNLEAAANLGSVHLMAEYFDGEVTGASNLPDLAADGYYFQAGWIVTGESRKYKNGIAAFDSVKPKGANGAWEVFARYDSLDVTGSDSSPLIDLTGEEADTITLGVNWYMNSAVKIAVNYVHAETDVEKSGEDDGDALTARLQIAF
ncbi:MAG: porin [Pseudomonadales bacterium]|nr:porin [Pseudomonadales bacterium]